VLKLNCFARSFVDGLDQGRNPTKMLQEFQTTDIITGIQIELQLSTMKIAMITLMSENIASYSLMKIES
jgi:hypothetical protein